MIPVGGDHVIVIPEDADGPDGDGLLPAILMEEAADLVPFLVEHLRPLFEPADEHHQSQPGDGLYTVDNRLCFGLQLRHFIQLLSGCRVQRPPGKPPVD